MFLNARFVSIIIDKKDIVVMEMSWNCKNLCISIRIVRFLKNNQGSTPWGGNRKE